METVKPKKVKSLIMGHNLVRLMKLNNIDNDTIIADKADTDENTVSRWKNGHMGIGKKRIAKLCEFFKIDETEFYRPIEDTEKSVTRKKTVNEMTKEELIEVISSLKAIANTNNQVNSTDPNRIADIKDKEKQALLSEFLTLLELLDRDNVVAMKDYVTRKITMLAGKSEKANKA